MSYSPPGGDLSLSWSVSTELSRAPTIAGIPSSTSSSVTSSATGGGGRTVSSSDENYIIDFDYNKNNTGQVYDAATSQPTTDSTFTMPFELRDETVKVGGLAWFIDNASTGLVKMDNVSATEDKGNLFQSTTRRAHVNIKNIITSSPTYLGQPMFFSINWTFNGLTGYTSSPAFSIVNGAPSDRQNAQNALRLSQYFKANETRNNGTNQGNAPPGSLDTNPGNGTSNPHTVGGSRGGGLSTGAIVGIAVGVGVAALLAAALGIFFFLRRRKSRTAVAAREDQTRAEKEKLSGFPKNSNGHANASDAAITPYRDEHSMSGGARGADGEENAAATAAAAPGPSESGSHGETQHAGVSRHLVEDGMTAAEIRRLEEEEAHLDDEIQRAGGRR